MSFLTINTSTDGHRRPVSQAVSHLSTSLSPEGHTITVNGLVSLAFEALVKWADKYGATDVLASCAGEMARANQKRKAKIARFGMYEEVTTPESVTA